MSFHNNVNKNTSATAVCTNIEWMFDLHTAVPVQSNVPQAVLAIFPGEVAQVAGPQREPALLPVSPQLPFLPEITLRAK